MIDQSFRYSRHLHSGVERIYTNRGSQIVIHAVIRSPKNHRRMQNEDDINNSRDLHSFSTILTAQYSRHRANHALSQQRSSLQQNDHPMTFSNTSGNYLLDTTNEMSGRYVDGTRPSYQIIVQSNRQDKNRRWFDSKSTRNDTRKTRKKRKKYSGSWPCSWSCLLLSLLTALLLAVAIAATLLALLFKNPTTATQSSSSLILSTTTASTTLATTTLITTTIATTVTTIPSTTIATTVASTAIPTTSLTTETTTTATTETTSTVTTTTITSCTTPASPLGDFNGAVTTSATYTYTASFTGTAVLEFGFRASGNNKDGYLDDVSVINLNASNSQMLTNGNFNTGTLIGWQQICGTTCIGDVASTSCNSAPSCYHNGCQGATDFIRQPFIITIGNVYTISFWIKVDNSQSAFVHIL